MKYQFTVDYIRRSFIDDNPTMPESHPDFVKAMSRTVLELEYAGGMDFEGAQKNVFTSFESDHYKVIAITGFRVE